MAAAAHVAHERGTKAREALAVGIAGKRALWQALSVAADGSPGLRGVDYDRLTERADEQRDRVEAMRLDAARSAFVGAR